MTGREVQLRTIEHDWFDDAMQSLRFGHLAPEPGAPAAAQVRCSCDRCGAHLLASRGFDGRLDGHCAVCVGQFFTPVEAHRVAA